jgi:hypothetical protein
MAAYIATGALTSPKLIEPFQIERGIRSSLVVGCAQSRSPMERRMSTTRSRGSSTLGATYRPAW